MLSRRWFLGGLIAAPVVVHTGVLMPVRALAAELLHIGRKVNIGGFDRIAIETRWGQAAVSVAGFGQTETVAGGEFLMLNTDAVDPLPAGKSIWVDGDVRVIGSKWGSDEPTVLVNFPDAVPVIMPSEPLPLLPVQCTTPISVEAIRRFDAAKQKYWEAEIANPGQTTIPYPKLTEFTDATSFKSS